MAELHPRLRPHLEQLACPACASPLSESPASLLCSNCKANYPVRNGKIYFIEPPTRNDDLDSIKGRLKKLFGPLYNKVGLTLFGPSYPFNYPKKVTELRDPSSHLVVDLGSGANRIHPSSINVDCFDYGEVDIVCDMNALPFAQNSVDLFASRSVLEHVLHPWKVTKKLLEMTCPDGVGLHLVPFMFPFHASPHDFCRFTAPGLAQCLFPDWETTKIYNASGPASWFTNGMLEILSTLFSFSNTRLRSVLYLFFCLLLFPIKFLDVFFVDKKQWQSIAPNLCCILRKS